jgi:hypothetical protein
MEITEKEKQMLEKERDEVKKLTQEIIELENDPKNSTEIKKRVIGIQFSINRMASYSNPEDRKLEAITTMADALLHLLSMNPTKELQEEIDRQILNPSEELIKELRNKHLKPKRFLPLNRAYPVWWGIVVEGMNKYCTYVNSIRFHFNRNRLKIVFPKKIALPDINLGIIFKG